MTILCLQVNIRKIGLTFNTGYGLGICLDLLRIKLRRPTLRMQKRFNCSLLFGRIQIIFTPFVSGDSSGLLLILFVFYFTKCFEKTILCFNRAPFYFISTLNVFLVVSFRKKKVYINANEIMCVCV